MQKLIMSMALLLASGLLGGCITSSSMVKATVIPQPTTDTALVYFMRPSSLGGAIQASVYDATDNQTTFIGIVSAKTKVAYKATPGKHLFMVIGENADFMHADLVAGKTCYALVSPRMGMWKARFSLIPIRAEANAKYSLVKPQFHEWVRETSLVQTSPAADVWYRENAASVAAKQADYMKKWNAASAEQHAELTLQATDCN